MIRLRGRRTRKAFTGRPRLLRRRAPTTVQGDTLERFAARAVRAAEKVATGPARDIGTFGGYKVFTHAARSIGKFKMPLPEFKKKLLEAHRRRLLTLARADLVEAMNPHDVQRSQIVDGGATYNFIVLDYKFAT